MDDSQNTVAFVHAKQKEGVLYSITALVYQVLQQSITVDMSTMLYMENGCYVY